MAESKDKMSEVVSFRTSKERYLELETMKVNSGMTRTECINYRLFGKDAKKLNMRRGLRYDLIELRKIFGELRSIGNNINQIARKANTFGFNQSMLQPINQCDSSIKKLADVILKVLNNDN